MLVWASVHCLLIHVVIWGGWECSLHPACFVCYVSSPWVLLKPFISQGVTMSGAACGLHSNGKPLCSDTFHVVWAPWFIWHHWLTLFLSCPLRSGKVVPAWPSGREGTVSEVLLRLTDAVGGAPVSPGEGCADLEPFCYRVGSPR